MPNFDEHSFNSGYAHRPSSWGKFIDFVSIQEQQKHVTIVLNQHGEFDKPSFDEYSPLIFTPERLELLQQLGYGKITLKGAENRTCILSNGTGRDLTVIVRPSFHPENMKQLQLASERLLATGMNTPAESWASKCKLYLYENVANGGVTANFLTQQIEVANTINPKLGRLLQIAGYQNKPLSQDEMAEAAQILRDPELSTATLNFCDHVVKNYRFHDAFLGSLKRTVWHHYLPELKKIEAESMDPEFNEEIVKHLSSFDAEKKVVRIKNLPLLAERVHAAVNACLENTV